jgi:hypothetical protein
MWEDLLILALVVVGFCLVSFLVLFLVLVCAAKLEVLLSDKEMEIDEVEN